MKGLSDWQERGDKLDDRKIILLLKTKPSDGLYEAMQKYCVAVRSVVRRILPYHPQDVEECVEDTFVNVWRFIDSVDPDTKTLKGLLLSTARNIAITRYYRLKRSQVISLETLDLAGDEDIAETVLESEATKELQRLVIDMRKPDREIFFRKYFLFESLKQIGDKIGLDEVQVRNKLYYGSQKLRKQLEERGISYEEI